MSPETLLEFKKQATKFYTLYNKLAEYWKDGSPQVTIISVLLQNIAFNKSNTVGYNHEKEVERCIEIILLLEDINKYHDYHMTNYAYQEINSLFEGLRMSEEVDQW